MVGGFVGKRARKLGAGIIAPCLCPVKAVARQGAGPGPLLGLLFLGQRPLESRYALEKAVALEAAKYLVGPVPRPPYWSGFRVTPLEIEFWHSRLSRLHERIVFKRQGPGGDWLKTRLYP
jgi:hypothetical protein